MEPVPRGDTALTMTRVRKEWSGFDVSGRAGSCKNVRFKRAFWCVTVTVPVLPHLEVQAATFSKTCIICTL